MLRRFRRISFVTSRRRCVNVSVVFPEARGWEEGGCDGRVLIRVVFLAKCSVCLLELAV